MVGPSLVCGINVCFVQLQDMHHMEENVRQSNMQLVFFFFSFFFLVLLKSAFYYSQQAGFTIEMARGRNIGAWILERNF